MSDATMPEESFEQSALLEVPDDVSDLPDPTAQTSMNLSETTPVKAPTNKTATTKAWTPKATSRTGKRDNGLEVKRFFTVAGQDPFYSVEW